MTTGLYPIRSPETGTKETHPENRGGQGQIKVPFYAAPDLDPPSPLLDDFEMIDTPTDTNYWGGTYWYGADSASSASFDTTGPGADGTATAGRLDYTLGTIEYPWAIVSTDFPAPWAEGYEDLELFLKSGHGEQDVLIGFQSTDTIPGTGGQRIKFEVGTTISDEFTLFSIPFRLLAIPQWQMDLLDPSYIIPANWVSRLDGFSISPLGSPGDANQIIFDQMTFHSGTPAGVVPSTIDNFDHSPDLISTCGGDIYPWRSGSSEITFTTASPGADGSGKCGVIDFEYVSDEANQYPIVGLTFNLSSGQDLTTFTGGIQFNIRSSQRMVGRIQIRCVPTDGDRSIPPQEANYDFVFGGWGDEWRKYYISFDKLKLAAWWFYQYGEAHGDATNLAKTVEIVFSFPGNQSEGEPTSHSCGQIRLDELKYVNTPDPDAITPSDEAWTPQPPTFSTISGSGSGSGSDCQVTIRTTTIDATHNPPDGWISSDLYGGFISHWTDFPDRFKVDALGLATIRIGGTSYILNNPWLSVYANSATSTTSAPDYYYQASVSDFINYCESVHAKSILQVNTIGYMSDGIGGLVPMDPAQTVAFLSSLGHLPDFIEIDNEPDIWGSTHGALPHPTTAHDYFTYNFAPYARAIKEAFPGIQIIGPALCNTWSGENYFNFPDDAPSSSPAMFLEDCQAYEGSYGIRLLDYFSFHAYNRYHDSENPYNFNPGCLSEDDALQKYIKIWNEGVPGASGFDLQFADHGPDEGLIPYVRNMVDSLYSGTKLALTEYGNYPAVRHPYTKSFLPIYAADLCGKLAQEGLAVSDVTFLNDNTSSCLLNHSDEIQPEYYVYQLYANHFKGQLLEATSDLVTADREELTVYATRNEAAGKIVVMIVNKTREVKSTTIDLEAYTGSSINPTFHFDFKARSLTCLEIPLSGTAPVSVWQYSQEEIGPDTHIEEHQPPQTDPIQLPFSLGQSYPNPTNGQVRIPVEIKTAGEFELSIYNIRGEKVATIHDGRLEPGPYQFSWDFRSQNSTNLPSGVYHYRFSGNNHQARGKIVLIK